MPLQAHIDEVRAGLRAGRYTNEAAVSQGIILRRLGALGWPTYDTQIVCPEYSLSGRRVDYALCHPANKPAAFIGRLDLAREHSFRLKSGWYVGTNVSHAQIERIIEMACEVSRVRYGKVLTINVGE